MTPAPGNPGQGFRTRGALPRTRIDDLPDDIGLANRHAGILRTVSRDEPTRDGAVTTDPAELFASGLAGRIDVLIARLEALREARELASPEP